jgi:HemY protein
MLLKAQAAQLSGDRAAAERIFHDMAARPDTRLLGLRGLYVEARRRDDSTTALAYAGEAAKSSAALSWAGQAVLDSQCASGDWAGALETLEKNWRGGLIDKSTHRRQRAVLLTARAMSMGDSERREATAFATEAARLVPDFVPAAVLAGRLLAEERESRKAAKILQAAWRAQPHPDIAEVYAYLHPGETGRARLARVQSLVRNSDHHVESALAVARAALDAREFLTARTALTPLLTAPTKRAAALMAELEQAEHGDEGRAREWMTRALRAAPDPAWIADGFVSTRWMPVSPVSGRLDAFEWKLPLAQVTAEIPVIEDRAALRPAAEPDAIGDTTLAGESATEATLAEAAQPPTERLEPASPPRPQERAAEAVIPLVHAPDDPGPEPDPSPGPVVDGRRGMRLFFR